MGTSETSVPMHTTHLPAEADGDLSPDEHGIGTLRWPSIVPLDELCARKLKKRTLTNLYNERPAWLVNAHRKLDEAMFAAYAHVTGEAACSAQMTDEQVLEAVLSLNLQRT